jgi:glycosyltransferase involved in cell wall biosynthesis
VKELFGKESVIINDSGTFNEIAPGGDKTKGETLRIIWVGIINSRKALEIGIKALAQTKINRDFVLEVCGNGPEEDDCKKLSQELGISGQVKFNGRLPHTEVIKRMREADLMLFTSLMEGTPNVVNEALSLGLPVICHNICGQGELINETCGLKVPLINPEKSAELFAEAIDKLTPESINRMSQNAFERAKQLTWYKKAESMYGYYQKLV